MTPLRRDGAEAVDSRLQGSNCNLRTDYKPVRLHPMNIAARNVVILSALKGSFAYIKSAGNNPYLSTSSYFTIYV